MMRVFDRIALSGMILGLFLLLFPLIRLTEWLGERQALRVLATACEAVSSPVTFKIGFFLTLIATIAHIFTSHLVKPKETDA